jgi:hypothetical protein
MTEKSSQEVIDYRKKDIQTSYLPFAPWRLPFFNRKDAEVHILYYSVDSDPPHQSFRAPAKNLETVSKQLYLR